MEDNFNIVQGPMGYLVCNKAYGTSVNEAWFSPLFWQQQSAIEGTSTGRFTTWFIRYQQQNWVLRHYWRGGMIAKLSKDKYIYTGLKRTRAIAEFALLDSLYQEGFAVPKPIAAKVERCLGFYSADIIIEKIADSRDLVAYLAKDNLTDVQWQALGQCIAKFHQRGVYHADLNAKNILISPTGFHLIDFDRGKIRTPHQSWQQSNLNRLLRSFKKEQAKLPQLNFTIEHWQQLLEGYHSR